MGRRKYHDVRDKYFQHAASQLDGDKCGPVGNAKQTFPTQKVKASRTPYRRSRTENATFRLTRAESILPVYSAALLNR